MGGNVGRSESDERRLFKVLTTLDNFIAIEIGHVMLFDYTAPEKPYRKNLTCPFSSRRTSLSGNWYSSFAQMPKFVCVASENTPIIHTAWLAIYYFIYFKFCISFHLISERWPYI